VFLIPFGFLSNNLKVLFCPNRDDWEQAAQGGGGVTIPGGVQKKCRHGTSGHGLVGMVVMG